MSSETRRARVMEHAWAVNDIIQEAPHEREQLRETFLAALDNDPGYLDVYESRRSVKSDFDAKPLMQLAADLFRVEFDLPVRGLSGL